MQWSWIFDSTVSCFQCCLDLPVFKGSVLIVLAWVIPAETDQFWARQLLPRTSVHSQVMNCISIHVVFLLFLGCFPSSLASSWGHCYFLLGLVPWDQHRSLVLTKRVSFWGFWHIGFTWMSDVHDLLFLKVTACRRCVGSLAVLFCWHGMFWNFSFQFSRGVCQLVTKDHLGFQWPLPFSPV